MLRSLTKKGPGSMKSFRDRRRASKAEKLLESITICNLFRYATMKDKLFAVVGLTAALLAGAVTPLALVYMSSLIDLFVIDHLYNNRTMVNETQIPWQELLEDSPFCVFGLFVFNGLLEVLLSRAGAKQAFRIRLIFMESVMHQEQKWIQANVDEAYVRARLEDLDRIEEGLGSRLGLFMSNSCTLIVCTLTAFATNWALFLLMLSPLPIFLLLVMFIGQRVSLHQRKEGDQLQIAAFTASEAIHNIRAVVAFGTEDKEVLKFSRRLDGSQRHAYHKLVWLSASSSLIWFFLYACYALAFWYGLGNQLLADRESMLPSHVLCPIFNLALALLSAAKLVSYGGTFRRARAAAKRIFSLADEVALRDESDRGDVSLECAGEVTFDSVSSPHPATPLRTVSFTLSAGQRLSLYDASWEKGQPHAIADMLLRFSDPSYGQLFVDGKDIRSYNVGWLRARLAVVRAVPVLFAATIADNIRYGNPFMQQSDIEYAAIAAQAHKFILKLPKKYDTVLSPCGAPLSLGQRQLLCVARAIARNASILVLENPGHNLRGDAAAMVIHAMENAMEGRTSILISNKAFKLRDHERIIVLEEGKVVEEGSYSELVTNKKIFAQHLKKELHEMKELGLSPLGEVLPPGGSILDRQVSSLLEQDPSSEHNEGFNNEAHLKASYSNRELISLLKEHILMVSVGCIFAALSGVSLSLYGVVFGDMLASFLLLHDKPILKSFLLTQCAHLVVLGLVTSVVAFFHSWAFTLVGERVGSQLLKTAYESVLRQPMAWFDNPKNEVTDVIRIILNDVSQVKLLIGPLLTLLFQGSSSLICWLALASCFYWRLGLCALSFAPAILFAVFFEHYVLGSQTRRDQDDKSRHLALDIINKLSTVKSLHQEQVFSAAYAVAVTGTSNIGLTRSLRNGLLYAVSQAVPLLSYTAIFYIACHSINSQQLSDFTEVFKLTESIIFGVLLLAQSLAVFAPNFSQARHGAAFVFALKKGLRNFYGTNRKFVDDTKEVCDGVVSFHSVDFRYSSCTYIYTQDQMVLRAVSFEVAPGQLIALAGEPGSGKRACLELLQLFDKPTGGEILLDKKPMQCFDVAWVRQQMGIVNLEPHFFLDTIWANVAYGQSRKQVTNQMVITACQRSRVHDFIMKLPQGYQTILGSSGTQGEPIGPTQKVLLSIARALLRAPKILLVDQSGWDELSEEQVKACTVLVICALEGARKDRTCITISPLLMTAEKCDQVWLLQQGRVIDQGKHQELLTRRPRYRRLFKELRTRRHDGENLVLSRSNSAQSDSILPSLSASTASSQPTSQAATPQRLSPRKDSIMQPLDALDAQELVKRLRSIEAGDFTAATHELWQGQAQKDSMEAKRSHLTTNENRFQTEAKRGQNISGDISRNGSAEVHFSQADEAQEANTLREAINEMTTMITVKPEAKPKKKEPPLPLTIVIPEDDEDISTDDEVSTPETPRKRINTMKMKDARIPIEEHGREGDELSSESEDEHHLTTRAKRKNTQPSDIIKRLSQKKLDRELHGMATTVDIDPSDYSRADKTYENTEIATLVTQGDSEC
ncbi:multidrug resistance protein 1A-like [Tropilaelaps mercedesae]|uniref:Multidrug resistance protein 1A-like n=1 Tax=Tropilaelaps mercedesae TaxID=418985 RepID=A0A1V9XZ30_9ACAR|nr:multidrug resistance protein 1A-like [Tropilaelaps mercedesae]